MTRPLAAERREVGQGAARRAVGLRLIEKGRHDRVGDIDTDPEAHGLRREQQLDDRFEVGRRWFTQRH